MPICINDLIIAEILLTIASLITVPMIMAPFILRKSSPIRNKILTLTTTVLAIELYFLISQWLKHYLDFIHYLGLTWFIVIIVLTTIAVLFVVWYIISAIF